MIFQFSWPIWVKHCAVLAIPHYLQPFVVIRRHSQPFAAIRGHSQPFAAIRSHSQPFAAIRSHSQLFATIYVLIFVILGHCLTKESK
ncbi:hypothetical protein [Paenibacillus odorifer]|uniref:hypothetical protein n=1 Tax=Paenibacillus odorifer TaxID=189426 RepID=UPI001C4C0BCB|nr:hypothetical protein [Paenibacillus odorifer]